MSSLAIQPFRGSHPTPSLEHATVGDVMHAGVISCPASTTASQVARMMATHRVHCVVVMGINQDRHRESLVWGMISDLDLAEVCRTGSTDQTAATLAREPVVTVEASTAIRDAARLMVTHGIGHLLVVDPELRQPTGVISSLDLAWVLGWGAD
ncbi:MAG: cyclic nucleotide-binding/CBS domain-containing protein [Solirubrobacteraceae bacterium]